jgi:tape measure domain-containing protein
VSDQLEFTVDTRTLAAAKTALEAVAGASQKAEQAATWFRDAQGRLREASGRFVPVADQVAAGLRKQGDATKQAATASDRLADGMQKLKGLVASYLTLQTAVRVIKEADAWQSATARLALYTGGLEQARVLQERLALTALQTGQSVTGLVQSYGRMAQSARELGASQDQLLAATKGVADAFRVGGTEAAQASAAAQQWSQAIAASNLAGDELRSILENAGRLAQAVADGLGVSVGQMRKLGAEGELTSRAVFLALLSQTRKLAEETAKLPLTVSQGWQNMVTAGTVALARLDQAIGGTQYLATFLDAIGSGILRDFAPDLFARQQGAREVRENRALTATGAATIINQNRPLAANWEASRAQMLGEAQRLRDEMARPENVRAWSTARRDEQRRRIATFEAQADEIRRRGASAQGRVDAASEYFAQGGGISQDAFRREVAAERGKAAAAEEAERARRTATRGATRAADRWADSEARARDGDILGGRRAVGSLASSTFDDVFDSITSARRGRAVRMTLPDAIRQQAAELSRPALQGMDLVRANMQPIVELQERQRKAAEETRRLWSENLSRGLYEGFREPIAEFLRTWRLNVKQMGDLLRSALANAIASVAANELTKLIYATGRLLRDGATGGRGNTAGNLFNLVTSFAGGGGGGSNVAATIPGLPSGVILNNASSATASTSALTWAGRLAPPAAMFTALFAAAPYIERYSGGNAAARDANAAFAQRFRAQQLALAPRRADTAAELQAVGDGMVIGAPAGYDVAPARGLALQGNTINIVVPEGTPRQQAESIVRELQGLAGAQSGNPSRWSEVYVS